MSAGHFLHEIYTTNLRSPDLKLLVIFNYSIYRSVEHVLTGNLLNRPNDQLRPKVFYICIFALGRLNIV